MKKLVFLLFTLLSVQALAQNQDEGEVIVIAELNRSEVEGFIKEVQAQFYEIFNANNEDDRYDIECYDTTPTGSHIRRQVCEPKFFIDARSENANNHRTGSENLLNDTALRAENTQEFEELQRRMEAMTSENAQFREIASILTQLQARLAQLNR